MLVISLLPLACGEATDGGTSAVGDARTNVPDVALRIEIEQGTAAATSRRLATSYSIISPFVPLATRTDGPCEVTERRGAASAAEVFRPHPDLGPLALQVAARSIPLARDGNYYRPARFEPGRWSSSSEVSLLAGGGAALDLTVAMPSALADAGIEFAGSNDVTADCEGHSVVSGDDHLVVTRAPGTARDDELVVGARLGVRVAVAPSPPGRAAPSLSRPRERPARVRHLAVFEPPRRVPRRASALTRAAAMLNPRDLGTGS